MSLLLVYGTLKKTERNSNLMSGKFLRQARTEPKYKLISFGKFPGLTDGTQAVEGELWDVDDATLMRLDYFEGVHHGIYIRKLIRLEDGNQAYAYCTPPGVNVPDYEGTDWHERS